MKQPKILSVMLIFCAAVLFILGGCLSVGDTPSPRLYMLSAQDAGELSQRYQMPQGAIIMVGPVKIPDYQNRPQIVTQNKDKMLTVAQFDRWGEHLDTALMRVITEDLTVMLPGVTVGMFPYNFTIPVTYQVLVDVVKMESDLENGLSFSVSWSVINAKNNTMLLTKKAQFHQEIAQGNYSGLSRAMSEVCALFSVQVAEALSELVNQAKAGEPATGKVTGDLP